MQAARELEEAQNAMHAARRAAQKAKPDMQTWMAGRFAERVAALQAFALGDATAAQQASSAEVSARCWDGMYFTLQHHHENEEQPHSQIAARCIARGLKEEPEQLGRLID